MTNNDFTPDELKSEQWHDAPGYEGFYQVSNLGRVKRIGKVPGVVVGRILKPRRGKGGYVRLHLSKRGVTKGVFVHQLVCRVFYGKPKKGQQPNHKNGIKDDNRFENLEWVTARENVYHRDNVLGYSKAGSKNPSSILTESDVKKIRALRETGKTCREIAERFGVCRAAISHICNRRTWKHIN